MPQSKRYCALSNNLSSFSVHQTQTDLLRGAWAAAAATEQELTGQLGSLSS